MPIIRVEMFEGRTIEQKRQLVRELTDCFVRTCGGAPQSVQILIDDFSKENWATGGELNSERVSKATGSQQ